MNPIHIKFKKASFLFLGFHFERDGKTVGAAEAMEEGFLVEPDDARFLVPNLLEPMCAQFSKLHQEVQASERAEVEKVRLN